MFIEFIFFIFSKTLSLLWMIQGASKNDETVPNEKNEMTIYMVEIHCWWAVSVSTISWRFDHIAGFLHDIKVLEKF